MRPKSGQTSPEDWRTVGVVSPSTAYLSIAHPRLVFRCSWRWYYKSSNSFNKVVAHLFRPNLTCEKPVALRADVSIGFGQPECWLCSPVRVDARLLQLGLGQDVTVRRPDHEMIMMLMATMMAVKKRSVLQTFNGGDTSLAGQSRC